MLLSIVRKMILTVLAAAALSPVAGAETIAVIGTGIIVMVPRSSSSSS